MSTGNPHRLNQMLAGQIEAILANAGVPEPAQSHGLGMKPNTVPVPHTVPFPYVNAIAELYGNGKIVVQFCHFDAQVRKEGSGPGGCLEEGVQYGFMGTNQSLAEVAERFRAKLELWGISYAREPSPLINLGRVNPAPDLVRYEIQTPDDDREHHLTYFIVTSIIGNDGRTEGKNRLTQ